MGASVMTLVIHPLSLEPVHNHTLVVKPQPAMEVWAAMAILFTRAQPCKLYTVMMESQQRADLAAGLIHPL